MQKYVSAAKKRLRGTGRNIFFYGEGDDLRLIACDGPWADMTKADNKTAVIILQPFAEEMNRCRRLVTLCQAAAAEKDHCSLTIDYLGTGDSAQSFEHARLSTWMADVHNLCDLALAAGAETLILVGIRFGGLLARSVAAERSDVERIICVQPQESYDRAMRQFIRIAAAALDAPEPVDPSEPGPSPTKQLENGATVVIGGYTVTSALYSDFKSASALPACNIHHTLVFAGLGAARQKTLNAAEKRVFDRFTANVDDAAAVKIDDVQLWHQGVPEEPQHLPKTIARLLSAPKADQENANAA